VNIGNSEEYHRLRTAFLRLRAALRDPNTGLFAYSYYFDRIRMLLADRPRIGVMWIGLGDRRLMESFYGWEAYDRVLAAGAGALTAELGSVLPERTVLATAGVHADVFTLFVPAGPRDEDLDLELLDLMAVRLEHRLADALAEIGGASPLGSSNLRIGTALLTDHPFHRFERRVHLALDQARAMAERPRETERLAWHGELQRLLRDEAVDTLFQPVVDLRTGETVGCEAFARGPERSVFRLPRVMFALGQEAGLSAELDRVCRRRAIAAVADHDAAPALLFVNTMADSLADPDWQSHEILAALERVSLAPSRVVLEVPESQLRAELGAYREPIAALRALGYRLSLDDAGSGTRTSSVIEELAPDFVKLDMTVVRGVDQPALQHEVVRSLLTLSRRVGAELVAERIESTGERDALLECGARWGQGYLFSRELPGLMAGSSHAAGAAEADE
jgi:EAL domain-containing protein (putative c-di-GMP-specific phosphodiesterase class I)